MSHTALPTVPFTVFDWKKSHSEKLQSFEVLLHYEFYRELFGGSGIFCFFW